MSRLPPHLALCALLLATVVDAAGRVPPSFDTGMRALTKGDYAIAYCDWLPLAERGYADAQYHIGWLYANGNGLAVDIDQALTWWGRAAGQGHADAQFAVGLAYTTGEGMKKDLDEAVSWYLAAARQGHQDARDILVRLNGDASIDLLAEHPELAAEEWFGWPAKINRDRINLRNGPGTEHAVVTQLDKGTQLRVIGQRGDWLMVALAADGEQKVAWVYRALVSNADG